MVGRGGARLLAPIALVVVVFATIVVLASAGGGSHHHANSPTVTRPQSRPAPVRPTYSVRPGDSLLSIAQRTGVPIDRLRDLNPGIDEQALQVGQRIKLRP